MITPDQDESILDKRRCWDLLTTSQVGRLAVTIGGLPKIFPITYVADGGTVVFRTGAGSKLAAIRGSDVAFEADGVDPDTQIAWSVVIEGRAEEIRSPQELAFAAELPLFPVDPRGKPHFVRIVPFVVSGRRFRIVARAGDPS
jgi:uncharacterized protein